jgi:hypothetical protein
MRLIIPIIIILLFSNPWVEAQVVQPVEAGAIADNWIRIVMDKFGSWGGSDHATIQPAQELRYHDRLVGYLFPVNPRGFIVVSLHKELVPVTAFSDRSDLNPADQTGMADLIKMRMFKIVNRIESELGPLESIKNGVVKNRVKTDYETDWAYISNYDSRTMAKNDNITLNYQESQFLLTTAWDQEVPYNGMCPAMSCTTTANGRAFVGCVATAGAQIMKYWDWPPQGVGTPYSDSYDWVNMPADSASTTTLGQQHAVAELSYEIGLAVDMTYACDISTAYTSDMVNVYSNIYRYSTSCQVVNRDQYTPTEWYDLIQLQLNQNRPVQYRLDQHSIVCDGWWSHLSMNYVHVNYGWAADWIGWMDLNELYLGDWDIEYMVINIFPAAALGGSLLGTYAMVPTFPYRYFDQDATGIGAVFSPGQSLQTLPGIVITGLNLSFEGTAPFSSKIFTRGNQTKGISIQNGTLKLSNGGGIRLN